MVVLASSPFRISPVMSELPHVVVVGGGITGLSAAYELQRAARATGRPARVTLVERDRRLGGKIWTEVVQVDGDFLVEAGPDAFLAQKPHALELARELGLADQLIATRPARHWAYVLVDGRPRPLPDGLRLIVPTKLGPFLRSPLLSPLGRLRMLLDLVIPPRRAPGDESLASFVRRRFGAEALERLAEPLLSGIYSADPERQSLLATFPHFRALEERAGSVIRGARRGAPAGGQGGATAFVTLRGGTGALVAALAAALGDAMLLGRSVVAVHPSARGPAYRLELDDGRALAADAVLLTTPAAAAAGLVQPFAPDLAAELRQLRSVSTATVALGYRAADVPPRLDGYGVVVPRRERRAINACTLVSAKFAGRAPAGAALVRAFVGGARRPELLERDDAALVALVRADLADILGIRAAPRFVRVYRWPDAQPQYDVGHLNRVARIRALCPPGLHLAGCAYEGVGIPDCIRQGRAAARLALAGLVAPAAAGAGAR